MIRLQTRERTEPGVADGFLQALHRFPDRAALYVDDALWTYERLARMAGAIAVAIRNVDQDGNPLVGILAHRSVAAYSGVLGTLLAGKGYVPLNPKLPIARLAKILAQSKSRTLVVGKEAAHLLDSLLAQVTRPVVVLYQPADQSAMPVRLPGHHRLVACETPGRDHPIPETAPSRDRIIYLLFTSGSTGEPKGVPVRYGNVRSYVEYICRRYEVTEDDRFSQMFDLSFDLSVHDMLVCWERGACLYSVPDHAAMAPGKFIRDHRLTMWFSVPSVVGVMLQLGMLKPGSLPSLRGSLFCGEPLPVRYAEAWQDAAPGSFVENLYGPSPPGLVSTASYRSAGCSRGNAPVSCRRRIARKRENSVWLARK
jgi:non-ribosomal peptide synthetase component F